MERCSNCRGSGKVMGMGYVFKTCTNCKGEGKVTKGDGHNRTMLDDQVGCVPDLTEKEYKDSNVIAMQRRNETKVVTKDDVIVTGSKAKKRGKPIVVTKERK